MSTRKTQIACSVGDTARKEMDEYAERHAVTLTEAVRRAAMLLAKVDRGELRVFTADGETRAEVFTL